MNEYYTVDEVANLLKVTPQTVRHWISKKTMNAVKITRRLLIPKHEVDTLLNPMPPADQNESAGSVRVVPAGDVKTKTELEDYFKGK